MATQTPRRDNTHGEESVSPIFSDEHNAVGYDKQTTPLGNSSNPGDYNPQKTPLMDSSHPLGYDEPEVGRSNLDEKERLGSEGMSSSVESREKELINRVEAASAKGKAKRGFYRKESPSGFGKFKGKLTKKAKARIATITITSMLGIGGIFGFSILQGPFQLIHLSQIFQKNNFGTEKTSALRMQGLWRFHKTGDIGETRVGAWGSRTFSNVTERLKNVGIEYERNRITGHPTRMTIDPRKHPATRSLPVNQQRAALDRLYGVDENTFQRGASGTISADIDPTSRNGINLANSFLETSLETLEDGKTTTALNKRAMKKFFNLPKLFSPLSKIANAKQNQAGAVIASAEEQRKADEERRKQMRGPVAEKAAAARENIKNKINGKAGYFNGALLATAGLCLVRSVADSVPIVNRAEIVAPAAIEAVDKDATGSQVQSGKNFDMATLGPIVQNFEDQNGETIWKGKAVQATAGKEKPSGPDITDDYKQAFSNQTTAQKIKDSVGSPKIAGVDLGAAACSPIGLTIQGGVGLGLLLAGPFTAGGSWAVFAAKTGASGAATYGVLYLLQNQFEKLLSSDALLPPTLSGPMGGNLLAYGSRESANIGARASGGVELSDAETAALDKEQELESKKEFQSKSLANRIFDPYDHRSLASNIIDNSTTDPRQNATNLASSVMSVIPNVFSSFTPKVSAAQEPYDWGFPRYGIPKNLAEDPEFEDPYDNANKVATLMNSGAGNYVEKARKCFGVEISNSGDGWNAVAQSDVNPASAEYVDENCNDSSDTNWKRVRLFVFDTRLMGAIACFEGEDDACNDIGASTPSGPAEAGDDGEDSVTVGEANIKKINPTLGGSDCNCEIDPKGITLHWWGDQYGRGIDALVDIFNGNGLSVQLGITSEGEVYQLTDKLTTKTSHAIGGNATTIGIEIEGGPGQFGKEGIEKYPKKFEAVVATVQYLKDKYNIPIKKNATCDNASGILQHSDFNSCPDAVHKTDIDDYYYNEVIKRVK